MLWVRGLWRFVYGSMLSIYLLFHCSQFISRLIVPITGYITYTFKLQILAVGQCDVKELWCAEKDIPSALIDEYNLGKQPFTEAITVNYSGQAATTAIVTTAPSLKEPPAKKTCTQRFDSATTGYNFTYNIHFLKISTCVHLPIYVC